MISRCYVPRSSMVMAAYDAAPGLVNLSGLMDDAKCFASVRQHRWPEGVRCPGCGSAAVIRDGFDDSQPYRQRYRCKGCARRFDDLNGTVLAGHHQPLRVWVLCLTIEGTWSLLRSLAAPAPGHLTGEAATLPRCLRVRAQRSAPRQGPSRRPHRSPGEIGWPTPRIPVRAILDCRADSRLR